MQTDKHTWVVNVRGILQRAQPNSEGGMTVHLPSIIPNEDLRKIGNYKPLIIAAPSPYAQAIAHGFSSMFRGAPVATSWLLQCEPGEAKERLDSIWESVEIDSKEGYKIKIFIPEP